MPCNCQPTCTCNKGSCSCADCPNSSSSNQQDKKACGCGETCSCAPGQCKCESCPAKKTENTFSSSETAPPLADVSGAAQVDGEKKESSGCSCKAGCSCAPGKCGCGDSCSGSNKKTENTFSSSESAKPAADVSGAAQVDQ